MYRKKEDLAICLRQNVMYQEVVDSLLNIVYNVLSHRNACIFEKYKMMWQLQTLHYPKFFHGLSRGLRLFSQSGSLLNYNLPKRGHLNRSAYDL